MLNTRTCTQIKTHCGVCQIIARENKLNFVGNAGVHGKHKHFILRDHVSAAVKHKVHIQRNYINLCHG